MLPIQTSRLELRDFRAKDFDAVHAYASDPLVTRFTSWGPNSEEETRAFLDSVTAEAAAIPESLKVADPLIKERMSINKRNRDLAFEHMDKLGVAYIPSHSNFFMMAVASVSFPELSCSPDIGALDGHDVGNLSKLAGFTMFKH